MLCSKEMRRANIWFLFFLAGLFACGRAPTELRTLVEAKPLDEPDPALLRLNPAARFQRARLADRIMRAVAYSPGENFKLDSSLQECKFFLGILPEYFSRYREPVTVRIITQDGASEELVWSRTIAAEDSGTWLPVELKLEKKPEALWLSSDVKDFGLWLTPAIDLAGSKTSRPSIVFILVDAMRADHLGAYGYARNTSPNIDKLAQAGTIFLHAQTASPFTVTSLSSFFSGMSPFEHKVIFNYSLVLDEKFFTLAQKLREGGYYTAGFSGTYFHLSDFGLDRGFDFFDESCERAFFSHDAECLSSRFLSWLPQNPQRPLFLYFHYTSTHAPYNPPDQYQKLFSQGLTRPEGAAGQGDAGRFGSGRKWYQLRRVPSSEELAWLVSQYDGEIRYADEQIGAVLAALKAAGIENPLLIITADHGEAFYEHGFMEHSRELHWETARIPLIISGPGVPAGQKLKSFVRSYDLAPTIIDFAGLPALAQARGFSLRPLLNGQGEAASRIGYGIIFENRSRYQIAITRYPFRLLAWEPGDKELELFNLEDDPGEKNNLAAVRPEILKELLGLAPDHRKILSSKPGADSGAKQTRERLKTLHYLK